MSKSTALRRHSPVAVPLVLYRVSYIVRTTDEAGSLLAVWSGQLSPVGAYVFLPMDGGPTIYLFRDEFTVETPDLVDITEAIDSRQSSHAHALELAHRLVSVLSA